MKILFGPIENEIRVFSFFLDVGSKIIFFQERERFLSNYYFRTKLCVFVRKYSLKNYYQTYLHGSESYNVIKGKRNFFLNYTRDFVIE